MPALSSIALRFLLWLIVIRVVYALAAAVLGIPHLAATDVILSSVPMLIIGQFAAKTATRDMPTAEWVMIWAVCLGVFTLLLVLGPLAFAISQGVDVAAVGGIRQSLFAIFSTGIMMGVFLLIGSRVRR